jgi:hypothetical protein
LCSVKHSGRSGRDDDNSTRVRNDDVPFVVHFRADLNRVFFKQQLRLRPVASNECDPNRSGLSHDDVAVSQSIDEIVCGVTIIRVAWYPDAYAMSERCRALTSNLARLRDEVQTVLCDCASS